MTQANKDIPDRERLYGRILKGVGGFYYVHTDEGIYQCRAKGLFRKKSLKPLAGDECMIELTHTDDVEGNVTEILPRKNALVRPPVANIDQALVIFSMHSPDPVWGLLDRFLIMMEKSGIPSVICINKDDLAYAGDMEDVLSIYGRSGYRIIFTSARELTGMDELRETLDGKVTSVAGPSGAGKSSIINAITGKSLMETGEVSLRLGRGKQTTRHTELIYLWMIRSYSIRRDFPQWSFRIWRRASLQGFSLRCRGISVSAITATAPTYMSLIVKSGKLF